jgi:beta-glucosidase
MKGEYVDRSNTPLYPFGYGAGYTSFAVSSPELSSATVATDGSVMVSVRVENTGTMARDEVVQVYARRRGASVTRPVRELVGLRRVSLEPGEANTLRFGINADLFGFHDRELRFVVEPGPITLATGTSSRDLSGTAGFELVGPTVVEPDRTFFSTVTVT